jgi:predicted transcriptional regulator
MKTTVELPDALVREAQQLARAERTTLKALLEQGLRVVLARRADAGGRFRIRDASVDGEGLSAEFRGAGWEQLREASYTTQ